MVKAKTSERVKLTKAIVEKATKGELNQRIFFDTDMPGFGLLVGATTKSFIAQKDVKGRSVRVTIGRYPVLTVEQARREAQQLLAKMALGRNPVAEKKAAKVRGITLEKAWELCEDSLKAKGRSPKTIEGYAYAIQNYLKPWLSKPLAEITRADARAMHRKIATDVSAGKYANGRDRSDRNGQTTANGVMVAFRAVYNRALREHETLPPNPTINIDWFRKEKHHAALPLSELHRWHSAVVKLENPIRRDVLLFMLFTGLRRTNACEARWEHIDFENRLLHIPKPKSQQPFDLPLSNYLVELLQARQKQNAEFFKDSPWVFPSATSASGHIEEPRENFAGIIWTPHDLRRWFITVAESLDLSPYSIKLLVNHSILGGDVTAGYIQHELERLRGPMQMITDKLRVLCTSPDGKVTKLSSITGRKKKVTRG